MSFNTETLLAIYRKETNHPELKFSKDAGAVSSELLTIFTTELVMRSVQQAVNRRKSGVNGPPGVEAVLDVTVVQRVLPQLLLDFH